MKKRSFAHSILVAIMFTGGCASKHPSVSGKWVTPTACAGTVLFLDENESTVDGLGYTWNDVGSPYYFQIKGERLGDSISVTKNWINSTREETVTYFIREEKGMGMSLVNTDSEVKFPNFKIIVDSFVRPDALELSP